MIEATINGYSTVGTKATFAVLIEDHFENRHERVVPLTTKSAYLAELAALKYILTAVKSPEKVVLNVRTSLKHLPPLFTKEDNKWKKKTRTNKELIKELRDLSETFSQFSCELDLDSERMTEAKNLARSLP